MPTGLPQVQLPTTTTSIMGLRPLMTASLAEQLASVAITTSRLRRRPPWEVAEFRESSFSLPHPWRRTLAKIFQRLRKISDIRPSKNISVVHKSRAAACLLAKG